MNGVTEYTEARVSIFFEKGHVSCMYCPLLETYSRNQCRKTGEYLLDIKHTTGRWCPLEIEEDDIPIV